MRLRNAILLTAMGAIGAVVVGIAGMAQQPARRNPDADWPTYNRDLAGTRYSPLTQINTANVGEAHASLVLSTAAGVGRRGSGRRPARERLRDFS